MVVAETSSDVVPSLGSLAGTIGVGVAIALVVVGMLYVFGVVSSKLGWKFLDRIWSPREIAIIVTGAMVVGSASSAVAWSSQNLWKIAAKPEQASVRPAYAVGNDCEPQSFKTHESVERVDTILGASGRSQAESTAPAVQWDKTEESGVTNVGLEYKPAMDNGGSCVPEDVDVCFQVKVTYDDFMVTDRGGKRNHPGEKWVTAEGYEPSACGDIDAQRF